MTEPIIVSSRPATTRKYVRAKSAQEMSRAQSMKEWVGRNRNALTEIARSVKPEVSPQFVHLVAYGRKKSAGGRVERALKGRGAPIK